MLHKEGQIPEAVLTSCCMLSDMGAANQTLDLWKGSKCAQPLSHLFRPRMKDVNGGSIKGTVPVPLDLHISSQQGFFLSEIYHQAILLLCKYYIMNIHMNKPRSVSQCGLLVKHVWGYDWHETTWSTANIYKNIA